MRTSCGRSIDFQFLCRNDRRWEAELIFVPEKMKIRVRSSAIGCGADALQLAAETGV